MRSRHKIKKKNNKINIKRPLNKNNRKKYLNAIPSTLIKFKDEQTY